MGLLARGDGRADPRERVRRKCATRRPVIGAEVPPEALEFMLGHGPTSAGGLTGEGKTSRAGPYARRPAARRETVHDSTASGERGYNAADGTRSSFSPSVSP